MMKRWRIFLFVTLTLLIISGTGYLGFQGTFPLVQEETPEATDVPPTVAVSRGEVQLSIITPGQLINYRTVDLPAETTGLVETVNVRLGETVQAGDVLIQLGGLEQLQATRTAAEIALLEAQAAVNDLYANADLRQAEARQAIAAAQATINAIAVDVPLQQSEALQAITKAQETVADAEYRLNSLNATVSESNLTAAQARVALAAQTLKQAEAAYAPYRNKPDDNLNKARYGAAWADAQQAYDATVRQLNALTGSPNDLTIAQREAELAVAQAQLAQAQATYDALVGGIAPAELTLAEAQLAQAQAAYDSLEEGINPDELALAHANLELAQINASLAEAELQALQILAPFDGVIVALYSQAGSMVGAGHTVVQLADPQALEVLVTIVEEDYPLVVVGQPVMLYLDAVPELEVAGRVDRIVPRRIEDALPQYQVYISIAEIPAMVVDGMTADAAIMLASRADVLRLPRTLVRANADGTATVLVWMGGHSEQRSIIVGLRGDRFIEILSGLREGEQVMGQ